MKVKGIFYYIKIKRVTRKHLNKKFGKPDEELDGFYCPNKNIIYLSKELDPYQEVHTFFHEIYHGHIYQMSGCEEEAKCDAFGRWAVEFFGIESIKEFIK